MEYLWLNGQGIYHLMGGALWYGWGSYDKVSCCFVWKYAQKIAAACPQLGPFFLIEGRPLTREVFVAKVREALSEAGFDPLKFAGHSFFRIGAVSTAASRGVEDSLIKTLGRWRSLAYLLYVRIP